MVLWLDRDNKFLYADIIAVVRVELFDVFKRWNIYCRRLGRVLLNVNMVAFVGAGIGESEVLK